MTVTSEYLRIVTRNNDSGSGSGMGIGVVLGVVFVVLKLVGVISWSWWFVTMPFYAPVVLAVSILLVGWFITHVFEAFRR